MACGAGWPPAPPRPFPFPLPMKMRLPFLTLTLAVVAMSIHLIPGATELLQYDRAALASGEVWRWLTGHVAHFGANHLLWDVSVLVALGWTCEREARGRCALALALAAPAISAALWFIQPQFELYRGLSGLDSALFGLLAGLLLRRGQRGATLVGLAALVAIAAKSLFEIATASTLFASGEGYLPVPLAHLVGLGAGLLAAYLRRPRLLRSRRGAVAANAVE